MLHLDLQIDPSATCWSDQVGVEEICLARPVWSRAVVRVLLDLDPGVPVEPRQPPALQGPPLSEVNSADFYNIPHFFLVGFLIRLLIHRSLAYSSYISLASSDSGEKCSGL
ncbi:hypothetical protein SAY87_021858 [Trapa incisa]|uniref:Uncharacterized protein n=1 Tax=Trapa incisa TaxID=236973 RepID=A0AAN7JRM6_9MYRT|nr:hypothetical protein SAY87_021858 [Trapa incisa]